jgi:hypothetical protein
MIVDKSSLGIPQAYALVRSGVIVGKLWVVEGGREDKGERRSVKKVAWVYQDYLDPS